MSPKTRLYRAEQIGIGLLFLAVVAFGVVVEIRSAFQTVRRTDFGVYARAAWAVRSGHNLYEIVDNRGWHYCYPPTFAVLMTPLADPPRGESRVGYLPFAVSVGIWYAFNIGCLWFALTRLATLVLPREPVGTRRWWTTRSWPLTFAIGAIGYTLARGQVNVFVVALIVAMFADHVRGQRFRAGLWLGAAISIKVIPAFLGLYFLWKRDFRAIAGVLAALVLALGAIPSSIWGVPGAIDLNRQLFTTVLQPGSTGEGDQTRAKELTNATATDSQSFQSMIHNWRYPDAKTRPAAVASEVRLAHWIVGGMLTAFVLLRARTMEPTTANDLVFLGILCILMLHLTPVSHMHYYAYTVPLVSGLWLKNVSENPDRSVATIRVFGLLAFWGIATATPLFPGPIFDLLRNFGFGQVVSMVLIVLAARELRATPVAIPLTIPDAGTMRAAA